jgi:hypothetical protein
VLDGTPGIDIQVGIGTATADQITIAQPTELDAAGIGLATGIDTAANAGSAMDEILAASERR